MITFGGIVLALVCAVFSCAGYVHWWKFHQREGEKNPFDNNPAAVVLYFLFCFVLGVAFLIWIK